MAEMKLPKAVREAGERADALLKSLEEPQEVENPEGDPPVVEPETKPVVAEVTPPVKTGEGKTAEYWEHRFKTLQGIQEAEKRKHLTEIANLATKVNELTAKVNAVPEKPAVPAEYDLRKYFSESEISSYGEDLPKVLLRVAGRLAEETSTNVIDQRVKRELEPVKEDLKYAKQNHVDSLKANFWRTVENGVPNWKTINIDPDFHQWLAETDPITLQSRQEILTNAENNLNGVQVVSIFKAYEKSNQPAVTQVQPQRTNKVLPESTPTIPNTTSRQDAPLFTAAEIKQHNNDFVRGAYKNRMAEWVELEKKMNEAIRLKRIA